MSNAQLEKLKALAAQNAETADDMNEMVAGGGKKLPIGPTLARLVQVIETGNHPQEFQGKAKDPASEVILAFELYDPGFAEADGTPYLYRTQSIKISRSEKAGARKIFLKMNWKKTAGTFAELLDEPYLLYFKEVDLKSRPGEKAVVWDRDNILPALEPRSGQPYPVPPGRPENYIGFLWDYPDKEEWDKLHISGTRDDGKSKNWLQEKILSAVNFNGSKLQQMLGGVAGLVPTLAAQGVPAVPSVPTVAGAATTAPAVPATPPSVPAAPTYPALPQVPNYPAPSGS